MTSAGRTTTSKGQRGFTLIELLLTTVIIGIVVAIAVPKVVGARERAYDAAALADLRNMITAIEAYYADHLEYPTDISEVDFEPSDEVRFLQFTRETEDGVQSVHIHVAHDKSDHYYHAHYPAEAVFDKRDKR